MVDMYSSIKMQSIILLVFLRGFFHDSSWEATNNSSHWRQGTTVDGQIDFHGKGKARHFGEMWEQFQHFRWTPKVCISRGDDIFFSSQFFLVDFFSGTPKSWCFFVPTLQAYFSFELMFILWGTFIANLVDGSGIWCWPDPTMKGQKRPGCQWWFKATSHNLGPQFW